MISVHLGLEGILEADPVRNEAHQLHAHLSMLSGDAIEQVKFLRNQMHIADRPNVVHGHGPIPEQGLAAEDDALVGFVWGHAMTIVGPAGAVKDWRP